MIVFDNYAILIVVNVILSLKYINAPVPDEYLREALLKQHECIELLKKYFPGNDVREHAKIAFHYLDIDMKMYNDIRGYYSSFKDHLREGSIPTAEVFCLNYNSPDQCKNYVHDEFGSPPYEALIKAFYKLRHNKLIPKYVPKNNYNQTNLSVDENMRLVVDVIAEYWDTILKHFGLVTALRNLNAPLFDEINAKVEEKRFNCFHEISLIFTGDDLREHARIAIDYIAQLDNYSCYVSFEKLFDYRDIFAYYTSFDKHLLSGSIPNTQDFCSQYSKIIADTNDCVDSLNSSFGSDTLEALKKIFYTYRYKNLPQILKKRIDNEEYINIAMSYWNAIKEKFELKTGENGMLAPREFCEKKYPMPHE